jgi:hypothetical protein
MRPGHVYQPGLWCRRFRASEILRLVSADILRRRRGAASLEVAAGVGLAVWRRSTKRGVSGCVASGFKA